MKKKSLCFCLEHLRFSRFPHNIRACR
ncbi:hypothetical protein Gorai_005885 [Gossypium raimondii]|uniref:Uncharacterized protein n=1 Tax=Gossypium raimondii TaxID=29730 RepID=A0A7J8QDQ0_GOSRA|nr:hypothetical protein [Gossypium raimondii]